MEENKTKLFEKIKNGLVEKELEVITSLLMGESLKETAEGCGLNIGTAAQLRTRVYYLLEDFGLKFGNKRQKQKNLIEQLDGMLEFLKPEAEETEKELTKEEKLQKEIDRLVKLYTPLKSEYLKDLTIEQIAELAKKAILLTAENSNLNGFIMEQAERIGNAEDTDKAIALIEKAIDKYIAVEIESDIVPKPLGFEGIKTGNFLVYNPQHGSPNKIYKNIDSAETDAKAVAKKEQQPVYILKIEKLIVPTCTFETYDFTNKTIAENYLTEPILF